VLTRPTGAWEVIEAEPAGVGEITRRYVLPLAAIPAVAGVIGAVAFPDILWGVTFATSLVDALVNGAIGYVVTVVSLFLGAWLLNALAPAFDAQRSFPRAFKLTAYSATAVWVAGVLRLFPSVGLLAAILAAIWSLYTLYRGLPRMMRAGEERMLLYFAAWLAGAVLALWLVMAAGIALQGALSGPLSMA